MPHPNTVAELRAAAVAGEGARSTCELMLRAADLIESLRKDLRDQDREFQREARDIAAETRFATLAEANGEPYGTY